MTPLGRAAQAVQDAFDRSGVSCKIEILPDSTRSAAEAASAIGCDVAQIAKTIVFRLDDREDAVIVIASGSNHIDETAVSAILGQTISRATPAFVRSVTGFAIGGVPPCGHARTSRVLIDRELLALPEIWAAAGTPHAVCRLTPDDLVTASGGEIADVARRR